MISQIIDFLFYLIEKLGYLGLGIVMFLESLIAPIPSEAILPFAGNLAYQGKFNLFLLIIITTFGSYLGTLPFYYLGTRASREGVLKFVEKYGKWIFVYREDVEKAFVMFDKRGGKIVFLGKFIPIIRTIISLPAGVARLNFWVFTIYSLIGSGIWCSAQILVGYFLGEEIDSFTRFLDTYEKILAVVIIIGFGWIFGKRIYKKIQKPA
jgi:membrane protein DedA with SNARE-associated domain